MKIIAITGASALLLGACASSPVPADTLARSQAAVRSADEVGAQKVPVAALHLKVANEELEQARKLIADGDNKRAEYILLRAEADAEAALNLAREATARADAQKTIVEVQKMKTAQPEGT